MNWYRRWAIWVTALWLVLPATALAQVQEIDASGEYTMSKYETVDIAQQRALTEAERRAVEQAGVFIESFTKTENMQVVHDEVTAIAGNILKITDKKFENKLDAAGNITVVAHIKAAVDTKDAEAGLKNPRAGESAADYKALEAAYAAQTAELNALKEKMAAATPQEEKQIAAEVAVVDKKFQAAEKYKEGVKAAYNGDLNRAMNAYAAAIALNPNFSQAYSSQAYIMVYSNGDLPAAMKLLDKALGLDPRNYKAYYTRAGIYAKQGDYAKALADCNAAMQNFAGEDTAPLADAYSIRGNIYLRQGDYQKAIADLEQVIAHHNPQASKEVLGLTYNSLGEAYGHLGQAQKALSLFDKAIELYPTLAQAHHDRAVALASLGRQQEAMAAEQRAMALANSPAGSSSYAEDDEDWDEEDY